MDHVGVTLPTAGESSGKQPHDTSQEQLRDIYHTTFLLRQKLVPDVVPAIIHHAGLFSRHTYSTGKVDHAVNVAERTAPYTCLTTDPINSSARTQTPFRKVLFAIQSRDQGWVSNRDGGSWTWFTAGVLSSQDAMTGETRDADQGDSFLIRERQIYRNDVASKEFKTHIIEWTTDSENEDERNWVSSLQRGDKIVVRAWARFGGWQNKVKSVSVAVYSAAIV
ncbi:hypothetical protein LTR37_005433 [Vermiconidia calcicola]|uniref:Uncharacterized protein n=1 Tax=Vermiconidia calcicola TaxID=1690605 RepID=A0ACC3NJB8_9PEZI|nr:hypothetical protein LTR37_005433 [Vermiconidia calcicola]